MAAMAFILRLKLENRILEKVIVGVLLQEIGNLLLLLCNKPLQNFMVKNNMYYHLLYFCGLTGLSMMVLCLMYVQADGAWES